MPPLGRAFRANLLLLIMSVALAVGCAPAAPPAPAAKAKLRVSYQAGVATPLALVIEEKQMAKDSGVELQWVDMSAGAEIRDALVANSLEIGHTADVPFLVAASQLPIRAIALQSYGGQRQKIMVSAKSDIKDVKGLKGKKVGSQKGSSADDTFREVIKREGLELSKDVTVLDVKIGDMVASMQAGSIDAFVAWEPYPAIAEELGMAKKLMDFGKESYAPNVMMVNNDWASKNETAVVEFLKVWLKAEKFVNEQPEETVDILKKVFDSRNFKLSRDVIKKNLLEMKYTAELEPQIVDYLSKLAKSLKENNRIKTELDMNTAIVKGYLEKAKGQVK